LSSPTGVLFTLTCLPSMLSKSCGSEYILVATAVPVNFPEILKGFFMK
jgi:hypothetical protein